MENTKLKVMMPKVAIVEQLNWKLYDAGDYKQYDGLTELFVKLVEADGELLKDTYIKRWYRLSVEANNTGGNVQWIRLFTHKKKWMPLKRKCRNL